MAAARKMPVERVDQLGQGTSLDRARRRANRASWTRSGASTGDRARERGRGYCGRHRSRDGELTRREETLAEMLIEQLSGSGERSPHGYAVCSPVGSADGRAARALGVLTAPALLFNPGEPLR